MIGQAIETLREDIQTVFERDPAARSAVEVMTCYPGMHAVWAHRIAHKLWRRGAHLPARMISHVSRMATGVEIHPGATIGRRFFIDHGMGVVIGETAEIGDDCTMYHGVTLGGTSWAKEKRHPTLRNHVVVGAGAAILGPITVGDHAKIGSGSVVVRPIPDNATVVGLPASVVSSHGKVSFAQYGIAPEEMPDPLKRLFNDLNERITRLEEALSAAHSGNGAAGKAEFTLNRDHL
ncbi:MAG: Serine acetyltransferase [Myxococcota bacterium]|nr:Serine acetyltransferase [Myxococcota bacterium]